MKQKINGSFNKSCDCKTRTLTVISKPAKITDFRILACSKLASETLEFYLSSSVRPHSRNFDEMKSTTF